MKDDTGQEQQAFILHTDGGSRGNPGPSGIGFVLECGSVEVASGGAFIGTTTNNVAEYEALIWGLENAKALDARRVEMIADSELMVKQVTGAYKVKNPALKALSAHVQSLLADLESWTIKHTLREDNSEADALVNQALDAREEVGEAPAAYTPTQRSLFPDEEEPLMANKADKADTAATYASSSADTKPQKKASGAPKAAQVAQTPGTYYLTVKEHFDAAHSLYGYPGPCSELHGHTWEVEVTVCGRKLDEIDIVYDFKSLKDDVRGILVDYDHHHLNEVKPFDTLSPTAENLSRIIYDRLAQVVDPRVKVFEVAVWESPIARVAFRSDAVR
ncbi:MAG: 6-carboxytetrahydropterin synthase QueD [Coriobacteriia bacterium]|nr:6-carboxytetrahydropterin synthase QueD [Coriobacteriia bacterium]